MMYKGWMLWYDMTLVLWRAKKAGVTMNHPDHDALLRMIDQKRADGSYV